MYPGPWERGGASLRPLGDLEGDLSVTVASPRLVLSLSCGSEANPSVPRFLAFMPYFSVAVLASLP